MYTCTCTNRWHWDEKYSQYQKAIQVQDDMKLGSL